MRLQAFPLWALLATGTISIFLDVTCANRYPFASRRSLVLVGDPQREDRLRQVLGLAPILDDEDDFDFTKMGTSSVMSKTKKKINVTKNKGGRAGILDFLRDDIETGTTDIIAEGADDGGGGGVGEGGEGVVPDEVGDVGPEAGSPVAEGTNHHLTKTSGLSSLFFKPPGGGGVAGGTGGGYGGGTVVVDPAAGNHKKSIGAILGSIPAAKGHFLAKGIRGIGKAKAKIITGIANVKAGIVEGIGKAKGNVITGVVDGFVDGFNSGMHGTDTDGGGFFGGGGIFGGGATGGGGGGYGGAPAAPVAPEAPAENDFPISDFFQSLRSFRGLFKKE